MSDITDNICAIRREQIDSPHLLPSSQITSWVTKAESHIKRLKQKYSTSTEEEREKLTEEHECIAGALDDIQKHRADLIWNLAYDGAGDTSLMTDMESGIYRDLSDLARTLRGEE